MNIFIESIILALILIGISIFIKIKSTALHSKSSNIDTLDYKIIALLTSLFAMFTLINLGSNHTMKGEWSDSGSNSQLAIKIIHPTKISKIYYYSGINNGKYHWVYINENGEEKQLNDPIASLGYPAHFKWNEINTSQLNENISEIKLIVDSPKLEIKQLALFNVSGAYITNVQITSSNMTENNLQDLISLSPPNDYIDNFLSSTFFDEIFYATSAYQYVNKLDPYVAVHPPLGMLLIGIGILIFGMNAFGWRIIPALASIAVLPIIYIFAKKLLKTRRAAIIATILLMFDPMHYVMGKIAFLDGIVTLFILLQYYFLYSYLELRNTGAKITDCYKYLFLTGLMLGIGMSCKWSALYFSIPLVICLLYGELYIVRPKLKEFTHSLALCILLMIILPLTVYCISYIPFILSQNDTDLFSFIWRIQTYMYGFQAHGLANATHPYASSWYNWPMLKTPISLFFWQDKNSDIANSVAFIVNPLIAVLTFPVIILLIIKSIKDKSNFKNWFILIAICAQYLPYAFISHIMFLYYFYSTVPLLILGIVYCNQTMMNWNNKIHRYLTYGYILAVITVFIMFIPATSGFEFPRSYVVKYLLWRNGWNF